MTLGVAAYCLSASTGLFVLESFIKSRAWK